ncbi:MAG: PAS domain S-box protein [Bacteroidota bacterium]|nr:PAS domain S-box protein [Bacteroidota bacterium]
MKIKAAENILNLFDEAVLVADSSRSVIYCNNAFFEMFKTKHADVFGKNVYEWKNGQLKQLESIVSKILPQKIIVQDFELQLPDFTNKVIKVNIREELDIIKKGSNILFVFRENGDKQCNEENRKLASAISSINDAVCLTDLNHHLTFVNEAFLKLYGYTESEIIGKHVKFLRSPRMDQETINAIMRTASESGFVDEIWNKKKDGTEFLVQLSTGVIKNDKGETTAFIGVAKDITERKNAEEKLNSLAEHRKKLVEISESLFSTLSLNELLERIFKSLAEVIQYELSELYWLNEEKQLLESTLIPGSMDAKSGFQNWSIPLGQGLTSLAIEKQEAFLFNNAHLNPRSVYPHSLHLESDHLICIPILSDEKVIGVFDISRSLLPFTAEEFELVKLFIGYASLAIHNVQSFEKVKLSEERYRSIITWAPVGIYQSTLEGKLLSVNKRFADILGYSTIEELLNKNLNDIYFTPGERSKIISQHEEKGSIANVEVLWKKKDGSPIWIELAAHATKDDSGKTIYFEGFITDISERKKAQTDLQKSKNRYQDLVENINEIYYTIDAKGKLIYGSPNLFIKTGYSPEEIIGKNYLILISKEDRHKIYEYYLARTNDGTVDTKIEFRVQLKNGNNVWIEQSTRILRDEFGNLVEYRGIVREIDDRKEAEAALHESEAKYKKLFVDDITADFIVTPDGKLLACNPALVRMFAFESEEEALATNISELFTTVESAVEVLSLVKKHKRLEYHELEMRRRDGDAVFIIANIIGEFDENNNLTQMTGYLFDDTLRKQLEHQLRQSQKMESIGTLAGGIAHDFNNVLGAIMGYAELAMGKISITDPLSKYLQNIHLLTERGARITRQLLAFSRRQIIDPKNINLNILISDLLALIGKTIGEDIEIIFKPEKNIKTVYADSAQMEQVILNLCVNARDAMPLGGKLIIETKNFLKDETYLQNNPGLKAGEYVLLTVTDTGVGVPEEIRERIFEPFFTTKEQGKGTGLGLSMIHGIIGQHNGFIDLDSEISNGATFKIYIPAIEVKPDVAKTEFVKSNPTGNETILVVEDDADMREMISSLLGMMGYKIISASDGEEGIAKFNENITKINLIVSDVIMPRKGGKELYDYVKKKLPSIGFLFISGYTADALHKNFILDEKINFLSKPFSPNEIINKVREILDSV